MVDPAGPQGFGLTDVSKWTIVRPGCQADHFMITNPVADLTATDVLVLDGTNRFRTRAYPTGSSGDVNGPASSTDDAVARFDGVTGKLLQNSVVTLSDAGALAGVLTLNGITPSTIVTGPASATDEAVARFDSTTGKIVQNSVVTISDTGAVAGVLTLNGTTPSSIVVGPASATDNGIVRYDGTTGKLVQDSLVTVDDTTGTITFTATDGGIVLGAVSGTLGGILFTDPISGTPDSRRLYRYGLSTAAVNWTGPWVGTVAGTIRVEQLGYLTSILITIPQTAASGADAVITAPAATVPAWARDSTGALNTALISMRNGAASPSVLSTISIDNTTGAISIAASSTDLTATFAAGGAVTGISPSSATVMFLCDTV